MIKKIGATITVILLIAVMYALSDPVGGNPDHWWEQKECEEVSKDKLWECEE